MYIVFVLTALAVTTEAFGIALLLPLLHMIETAGMHWQGAVPDTADAPALTEWLGQLLHTIGIGSSATGILLFIALVFIVKGGIRFAEGSYLGILSAALLSEMKRKLFDRYSAMTYDFYSAHNTGHFINIISQQVSRLLSAFIAFKRFLSQAIVAVLYLGFAFAISWRFALLAVGVGVVVLVLYTRLNTYLKRLSQRTSEENAELHNRLVQTIQAFPYIAATAQFGRFGERIMVSVDRLTRYYRNEQIANAFTASLREPVTVILILGIVILQIAVFEAPIAPILVSLILIYRAMGHIFAIQSSWQLTMNMVGGLEMVEKEFEALDRQQEISGTTRLPRFSRRIELDEVAYSYPGRDRPALDRISLQIDANSTVALFGPSGAGKSTLIDMLTLLLIPQQGALHIDGVPHAEIDRRSWRRQIGYVPQQPVMFDDTVAHNISLWAGEDDRATGRSRGSGLRRRIEEAADRASALDFIHALPDGFDTVVGDRGIRLSGGQQQRLMIARELFKNPGMLILDEATSALDSVSEQAIRRSMEQLRGTVTMVVIAHRLSTIRHADTIFVLDEGRLVARGGYDELMAAPAFKRLAGEQL